jgi:ribonuclease HII
MRGAIEAELSSSYPTICGVDEVGRGCLAGPVYAAAVILDYRAVHQLSPQQLNCLRDSKTLSKSQRQEMLPLIARVSLSSAVARAEAREIEQLGIVPATFLAMNRALAQLDRAVDFLLIDGRAPLPGFAPPQRAVIKGDNLCYCIAAASIIAKEARDSFMGEVGAEFPVYGFAQHVGYGTKAHLEAIYKHGPCVEHRRNFAPISTFPQ